MKKTALITGIASQNGTYSTELLLSKRYDVHGVKKRSLLFNIDHLYQGSNETEVKLTLHYGDLSDDSTRLTRIARQIQPHETHDSGTMSDVKVSSIRLKHFTHITFYDVNYRLKNLILC